MEGTFRPWEEPLRPWEEPLRPWEAPIRPWEATSGAADNHTVCGTLQSHTVWLCAEPHSVQKALGHELVSHKKLFKNDEKQHDSANT